MVRATFFYGVVREADDVEIVHTRRADSNFDFDEAGVDTVDRGAESFEKHG
jgi:hypothetical protein